MQIEHAVAGLHRLDDKRVGAGVPIRRGIVDAQFVMHRSGNGLRNGKRDLPRLFVFVEGHGAFVGLFPFAPEFDVERLAVHALGGDGGAHLGVPAGDDARRVVEIGQRNALAWDFELERFFEFKGEHRHVGGGVFRLLRCG